MWHVLFPRIVNKSISKPWSITAHGNEVTVMPLHQQSLPDCAEGMAVEKWTVVQTAPPDLDGEDKWIHVAQGFGKNSYHFVRSKHKS